MTEIRELLHPLYPDSLDEVIQGIEDLMTRYSQSIPKNDRPLTEKDCILITYGDAIQQEGKTPLQSLTDFAHSRLSEQISAIHLLPCFPYTSDDGFSVVDYYTIDPNLGNWDDIAQMNQHFDLMLDAVVNHISASSTWFQGYLKKDPEYEAYFIAADPEADYSKVVRPRALPLLHEFDREGEPVHIWTTFSKDQVDLNFQNPNVFLHILDVLLHYVKHGARYIRLDAIAFLWKELGTSCLHLPQTHAVIKAYRKVFEALGSNLALITETNVPHIENISYFGSGQDEAHLVYNFTLPPLLAYSIHKEDIKVFTQWANSLEMPSDQVCMFNFTASHDGVGVRPLQGILSVEEIEWLANKATKHGGFISYKDNGDGTQSPYELNCSYVDLITDPHSDNEIRARRFMLSQAVMLCMPGVPGMYYHSVLGSQNDREAALQSGINRRINRTKLDADVLAEELEISGSLRKLIFDAYSQLLSIRRGNTVFNPFGLAEYEDQDGVLIILRETEQAMFCGLHNFKGQTRRIAARIPVMTDMISGEEENATHWELEPYSYKWLFKSTR